MQPEPELTRRATQSPHRVRGEVRMGIGMGEIEVEELVKTITILITFALENVMNERQ